MVKISAKSLNYFWHENDRSQGETMIHTVLTRTRNSDRKTFQTKYQGTMPLQINLRTRSFLQWCRVNQSSFLRFLLKRNVDEVQVSSKIRKDTQLCRKLGSCCVPGYVTYYICLRVWHQLRQLSDTLFMGFKNILVHKNISPGSSGSSGSWAQIGFQI